MATTAPSSASDGTWQAHDQEARLLGKILRNSRVALLLAEAGSDKTAFLKLGLMPLLRRRTVDQLAPVADRESGVVVPFPDRRQRESVRAAKRRELVVYFDDWAEAPLPALHACVHRAAATSLVEQAAPRARLSETLTVLSSRLDANFIILLDRFEVFLRAPPGWEEVTQFANELVEAINQPHLAANFLISLGEEARPRLASLRCRIPGFDDFSLRLTHAQGFTAAPVPTQNPDPPGAAVIATMPVLDESVVLPDIGSTLPALMVATAPASHATVKPKKFKLPLPPRVPVKTEDVYALIEATLAGTATEVATEPFPVGRARVDKRRAYKPPTQGLSARSGDRSPVGSGQSGVTRGSTRATAPVPTGVLGPESSVQTRDMTLEAAIKWVRGLLHRKSEPGS